MVCRMLVAAGRFPLDMLLHDFELMASNRNETHEFNENNPLHLHDHGWGFVAITSGRVEFYKKEVACWKDSRFREIGKERFDSIVLHARRASSGTKINYDFTQPFKEEGWFFCHNGTIYDLIKPNIMSDSKRFFNLIFDQMKVTQSAEEAIKRVVDHVQRYNYTALNFILSNGKIAFVLNRFQGKNPKYYTMKYQQTSDCTIVSSESLPHFSGHWEKMQNGSLLELDLVTQRMRIV